MTRREIDRRFNLHRPVSATDHVACDSIRFAIKGAALVIIDATPNNREQSIAIGKLEEALFFAIGAIVRPDVEY